MGGVREEGLEGEGGSPADERAYLHPETAALSPPPFPSVPRRGKKGCFAESSPLRG